jgi:hypothetical protein
MEVTSQMDLSEYLLIVGATRDRLRDLQSIGPGTERPEPSMSTLARLLYIASTLRARPRAIDRYIDYFGDRLPQQR